MLRYLFGAMMLWAAAAANAETPPPGWGESTAMPTGTPWVPPPGIVVEEAIMPFSIFYDDMEDTPKCRDDDAEKARPPMGHGGTVAVCLVIRNTNPWRAGAQLPIEVEILAGVTVISEKSSDQHGILLIKQSVTVSPGKAVRIPLYLICMNGSRDGTSIESRYRLGPVTDQPEAKKLIAFLENKNVPVINEAGAGGVGRIQRGKPIDQLTYDVMSQELERAQGQQP